jgi:hypothetical protein
MTLKQKSLLKNWRGRKVSFGKLIQTATTETKTFASKRADLRLDPRTDLQWDDGPWEGIAINPKHMYTCAELGRKWNWHRNTVANQFEDYPGVLFVNHQSKRVKDPETPGKTRVKGPRLILRIPGTVALKWLSEHTRFSKN